MEMSERMFRSLTVFLLIATFSMLSAQVSPNTDDVFFLDLGIVIEPSTGNETVNRLIKAPSEEVKLFLDKSPSGSVFMASTKELQRTLDRISERIESLETALKSEVSKLQAENNELRAMVTELIEKQNTLANSPPFLSLAEPSPDIENESGTEKDIITESESVEKETPSTSEVILPYPKEKPLDTDISRLVETKIQKADVVQLPQKKTISHPKPPEKKQVFNKFLYMNAVFAYQREDYRSALKHFKALPLENVDQKTMGNVLYWMADCYYQLGDNKSALETLQHIEPLIQSDKVDDALILTGLIYRNIGNEPQAYDAFTRVVNTFPESEYYRLAQLEIMRRRE